MERLGRKLWVHIAFALLLMVFAITFWPTILSLVEVWEDPDNTYSHAYLIIAIVVFYFFKEINIFSEKIESRADALVPLIAIAAVWLMGETTQTALIAQVCIPIILWLAIRAIFGRHLSARLIPLFAILYFSIPVWGVFTHALRTLTTHVVQFLLSCMGLPVFFDGFRIEVPAGVVEIASGCSGLNYFIVANAFTAIYAYQNKLKWKQLALCILTAAILAMIGNWIRVFLLVLVGYYSEMQHSLMTEHSTFGWVIFAIVLIPMFFIFRKIGTGQESSALKRGNELQIENLNFKGALVLICVLAVFFSPVIINSHIRAVSNQVEKFSPKVGGQITLSQYIASDWTPSYKGKDYDFGWKGDVAGLDAMLRVLIYEKQYQGKELIYYENTLAPSGDQRNLEFYQLPELSSIKSVVIGNGNHQYLVLWAYNIGGMYTTSELEAKALQFFSLIKGRKDASLVLLSFKCTYDCSKELNIINSDTARREIGSLFSNLTILDKN